MEALHQVDEWPVDRASVAVLSGGTTVAQVGPTDLRFEWASLTKLLTALAVLVGVEEGTISLDHPAGPDGSTVRHLLAHASGLAPDSRLALAPPGERRIYSNSGFELLADCLSGESGLSFRTYVREGVTAPLGMAATRIDESAATGASGPLIDLVALAGELMRPTLISPATLAVATSTAFPGLDGVLPGFGEMSPNDWGLGLEIRDAKAPHWTGRLNSPATFGHFARSGAFIWVDPRIDLGCVCVTDREFGPWATRAWPRLSDELIAEVGEGRVR